MDSLNKKGKMTPIFNTTPPKTINEMVTDQMCNNPCCFFCIMKEPDTSLRRSCLATCFKEMSVINRDDQQHVLVLSGLWNIAMAQPDDPEFISLGIFDCMVSLLEKGTNDRSWLFRDQNIYIPYYAAHVIGSYTMNKVEFAEKAVLAGVIPPLMELLRGKISWVEQRVAVRALGHLASYERTFEAVAAYEEELVRLTMNLASTCLDQVYTKFVGVKDENKRSKYHCDLLTRGVGGLEMENRKAEEWASQLQCWSLYLLNCFACKERSLNLICNQGFLVDLCGMWGGLVNHSSPAGVGLIRILCYSKYGRQNISESKQVLENLCHLSRSSDDWQYMGIDCLLLLLKDIDTRYKVIEIVTMFLIDLVELKSLGDRSNLGETITKTLLLDYKQSKFRIKNSHVLKALQQTWELKVERRKREKTMSVEKIEEKKVLVNLIKQQANHVFWLGDVEEAIKMYNEALDTCPLKLRKERMVLYSNRAQCYLLLRDPDAAIRDSTRALCLSNPTNSHGKSLWRRSQAYDMKGLAKESLMDCIMFINSVTTTTTNKRVKIPYYAARMISKQMEATWLFVNAQSKFTRSDDHYEISSNEDDHQLECDEMMRQMMMMMMEKKSIASGLSTIIEEPLIVKGKNWREMERARRRKKAAFNVMARSM
ncbi:ARM-repeat/Tetratricopeptide repeat-like protein [Gossypium australe]|uniref:ARM-repeat/Tetratricopeptide repeat-like protein n=1 Tax=Gossypium australe TaxID=47621 RepID=A0A5B6W5K0_9ROSI|nr:ARM-repeat/Tetratricopeptide repeat-like protein [Gossypium australe]